VWWVNDLLTRDFFGWPVRRAFVAKARKFATRLAPVSDAGRAALLAEGVPAGKIRTVHNGIPLERYLRDGTRPLRAELGLGPDEPMFGVVGRLTPWKGQDLFVRIAAGWHAAGRPGTFVIVGRAFNEDAPFEAALRARVAAAGLGSRVRFVPFRPGIAAALSSLDVLLHTSVKPEPFGRVIVEAMAVGTPVIAARAGGVPEIISDGEDGRLVAPGDEEEYLRGLADLQESPDLRARFAAAGRATVERRFGIGRVFRDFEELFSEARALGGE
jgi:glycosyltransferase involved in cell wall biosynthesis